MFKDSFSLDIEQIIIKTKFLLHTISKHQPLLTRGNREQKGLTGFEELQIKTFRKVDLERSLKERNEFL